MTKSQKDRAPRVEKNINAMPDSCTGIIKKISTTGGFPRFGHTIPAAPFPPDPTPSGFNSVKTVCAPRRQNQAEAGFSGVRSRGESVRIPESFPVPLNFHQELKV
ncbi:MAG: hypothetical protein HUN04_17365 [Desulfobacter sp.]|nr:MAG: hypothetical protein HUN04_17365 [Desulfobacter sp.]